MAHLRHAPAPAKSPFTLLPLFIWSRHAQPASGVGERRLCAAEECFGAKVHRHRSAFWTLTSMARSGPPCALSCSAGAAPHGHAARSGELVRRSVPCALGRKPPTPIHRRGAEAEQYLAQRPWPHIAASRHPSPAQAARMRRCRGVNVAMSGTIVVDGARILPDPDVDLAGIARLWRGDSRPVARSAIWRRRIVDA